MDTDSTAIDLTYLHSVTGGDRSFMQILLTQTVTDINIGVNGLKNSWDIKDAAGIRKNAHSLVSLAAIAGMLAVETWSRKIDRAFEDGLFHAELGGYVDKILSTWLTSSVLLEEASAGIE